MLQLCYKIPKGVEILIAIVYNKGTLKIKERYKTMLKKFSEVKVGKAIREYDEDDGVRYYIKVSDKGAICAFDYFEKLSKNPVVYTHFTIDDQMVDEVPKVRAKEWVKGDTSFEDVMTLIRELTKGE